MLIELGLVTTALSAGGALDKLATPSFKERAVELIKRSNQLDWHSYIAAWAWKLYTQLYGVKSTSGRFLLRSSIAYVLLIGGSILFLPLYSSSRYDTIVSVWTYGSSAEKLSWMICLLIGLPLYILANAQTLYFLEILRTTPNFFKFLLVAYADFLITSSIALFGVPAALLACSYIDITSTQRNIPIEIKFDRLLDSPLAETARALDNKITDPELYDVITHQDKIFTIDVSYSYKGNRSNNGNDLDFYLTRKEVRAGHISQASMSADGKSIRQTDASGNPTGYRSLELGFSSSTSSVEFRDKRSFAQVLDNFCKKFSISMFLANDRSILVERDSVNLNNIYSACLHERSVLITPLVTYNNKNVSYSQIYNYYLQLNLQDTMSNVTSGVGSYLTFSPYLALSPENGQGWFHKHNIAERDNREAVALDNLLAETLFYDLGGYNWIINKGSPAGSMNFAIYSTALFNVIVMSIFFIAFPIVKIASNFDFISKYITIENLPFTISSAVLSIWLLVLIFIATLLF